MKARRVVLRRMGSNASPTYLGLDLSTQQVRKMHFEGFKRTISVHVRFLTPVGLFRDAQAPPSFYQSGSFGCYVSWWECHLLMNHTYLDFRRKEIQF